MSMSIRSPELVRRQFSDFMLWLKSVAVSNEAVVLEHPVGHGKKGRCVMQYQIDQRTGRYRTVRTVYQPDGTAGKPACDIYLNFWGIAVLEGKMPRADHTAAWLHVGRTGVRLTYPNYESDMRCESPIITDGTDPDLIAAKAEYIALARELLLQLGRRGGITQMDADELYQTSLRG